MRRRVSIILAVMGALSIVCALRLTVSDRASHVAVIGGADGPTAIYIAGQCDPGVAASALIIGVALLTAAVYLRRRHKR